MDKELAEKRIDYIMENFEFDKVHKTMVALGWTWIDSLAKNGVPTLEEIKEHAIKMLKDAFHDNNYYSTAGFETVSLGEGHFELVFNVTSLDSVGSEVE